MNSHRTHGFLRRRTARVALVLALGLSVGACGAGGDDPAGAPPSTVASGGEVAVAPATTVDSTIDSGPEATSTTDPAPMTTPASTAPPTTYPIPTTVALPQPIAPPLDDEADEPVVALGRVAIPRLGLDATLYEGIRLPTFDLGPGHWPGSALPGQVGNMVIGGHRTAGNADFADLDELAPGDQMIVTGGDGAPHTYNVDRVEITDPFAQRIIGQTSARTATLFACHPPGSVDYRIVVHLTLVA